METIYIRYKITIVSSGADPDLSESGSSHDQTFQSMIFWDSPFLDPRLDIDQKYILIIRVTA